MTIFSPGDIVNMLEVGLENMYLFPLHTFII